MREVLLIILAWFIIYIAGKWIIQHIAAFIRKHDIKEVSRNPEWIMKNVRDEYYGFQDIDIVTADSRFNNLPCFRVYDNGEQIQYELLIPSNAPADSAELTLKIALIAKMQMKHGLNPNSYQYLDKSLLWLSILCYLLDGKDIKETAVSWDERQ